MSADEWADQNYAPTPYLVHAERHEAHELLHELPDLIGHTPAPLLDLLAAIVDGETPAAAQVLRWLRQPQPDRRAAALDAAIARGVHRG